MKEYFKLQTTLSIRKLKEAGLPPIVGFSFAIITFYFASFLLFKKLENAKYIYVLISVLVTLKLSKKKRNDFLKLIFTSKKYKEVRILENIITTLPFILFLLFKQHFALVLIMLFISIFLSILNFELSYNKTITTPFSKKPFEFTIGFRKTFFIIFIAYFIMAKAIMVDNFNLGLASYLLIALIVISYHSKPEPQFIVWIFNLSPKKFLIYKIKTAFIYFSFLILPILISTLIAYPNKLMISLLVLIICYSYILTFILAKYSSFPNEIGIVEVLLIALSIILPPILLATIPMFYNKAITQLKLILEHDSH